MVCGFSFADAEDWGGVSKDIDRIAAPEDGSFDQWDPAMSTLALMGVSVLISVIFGVPIGIWCSQSDRVA